MSISTTSSAPLNDSAQLAPWRARAQARISWGGLSRSSRAASAISAAFGAVTSEAAAAAAPERDGGGCLTEGEGLGDEAFGDEALGEDALDAPALCPAALELAVAP